MSDDGGHCVRVLYYVHEPGRHPADYWVAIASAPGPRAELDALQEYARTYLGDAVWPVCVWIRVHGSRVVREHHLVLDGVASCVRCGE